MEEEKFKLNVKLLTKFEKEIDLHKGVDFTIKDKSIYDAACNTIEIFGKEILKIKNKPKIIVLEVSGSGEGVEYYCLQGTIKYESFKWKKTYEGFPMFNESGEEPFSIESLRTVKPTIFEGDLVEYLNKAFPNILFKYKNEDILVQLDGKWLPVMETLKNNNKNVKRKIEKEVIYSQNSTREYNLAKQYYDLIITTIRRVYEEILIPNGINQEPIITVTFREVIRNIDRYENY